MKKFEIFLIYLTLMCENILKLIQSKFEFLNWQMIWKLDSFLFYNEIYGMYLKWFYFK